mmetsp:Transcript_30478/g.75673  ORF Transcript_30478/g.75673 Transcript_30478/m.75673 type:complete len:87 (+) Transcript_30478:419-679(+)
MRPNYRHTSHTDLHRTDSTCPSRPYYPSLPSITHVHYSALMKAEVHKEAHSTHGTRSSERQSPSIHRTTDRYTPDSSQSYAAKAST